MIRFLFEMQFTGCGYNRKGECGYNVSGKMILQIVNEML